MKGKIKCFGLLLVLAITLGLSLSVSSNANALKYEITTIPFGQLIGNSDFRSYGWSSNLYEAFTLVIPRTALDSSGNPWQYVASKNEPHIYSMYTPGNYPNECWYYSGSSWNSHNMVESASLGTDDVFYRWWFPYYDNTIFDYTFQTADEMTHCNKLGQISGIKRESFSSAPLYLKDYIPYRYNYNGIYAQDLNTQDGLYRQSRFRFEELFGNSNSIIQTDGELPDHFKSLTIPFGVFTEKDVQNDTPMEVVGQFQFDSDDPLTSVFTPAQDFSIQIQVNYPTFDGNGILNGSSLNTYTCNYELVDNRANEDEYPWRLNYSCPFRFAGTYPSNSPEKSRVIGFTLRMGGFEYSKMSLFAMTDVYFVTNGDLTPAGKPFSDYTIDGSSPQDAPGSALDPSMPGATIDWVESLSNLFSFQLFNPFSGFFLLFTDNSGCVNIPIIAGMLHSESDTYCPWFSADTRNIMTPVIGILATMFVFGFIVRWLKSTNSDFSPESSKGGD